MSDLDITSSSILYFIENDPDQLFHLESLLHGEFENYRVEEKPSEFYQGDVVKDMEELEQFQRAALNDFGKEYGREEQIAKEQVQNQRRNGVDLSNHQHMYQQLDQ